MEPSSLDEAVRARCDFGSGVLQVRGNRCVECVVGCTQARNRDTFSLVQLPGYKIQIENPRKYDIYSCRAYPPGHIHIGTPWTRIRILRMD
jgi:hypothetical protein